MGGIKAPLGLSCTEIPIPSRHEGATPCFGGVLRRPAVSLLRYVGHIGQHVGESLCLEHIWGKGVESIVQGWGLLVRLQEQQRMY